MSCRAVCWVSWIALLLFVATNCAVAQAIDSAPSADAGPTPVHAADYLPEVDTTWTPVTATPIQPPCAAATQEQLTKFSVFNIALQRRCQDQSGSGNAFPFDVAPSREQLVRLSASPACLMVSKGILRLVEHECLLGDVRMPIRATAETVLKLNQDRKDLALYPVPTEDLLQQQIVQRARMNHARDIDPIGFSLSQYSADMLQYESQLTKVYAVGGIVLLSSEYRILNDLSPAELQVGSEAATAAVAEVAVPTIAPVLPTASGTGSQGYAAPSAENEHDIEPASDASAGSYSYLRTESSRPGSASGSLTDPAVGKPPVSSASTQITVTCMTTAIAVGMLFVTV